MEDDFTASLDKLIREHVVITDIKTYDDIALKLITTSYALVSAKYVMSEKLLNNTGEVKC